MGPEQLLADWESKALVAARLTAERELWPAWSMGELLAVAVILCDEQMLGDLGHTRAEAINRLRYDLGGGPPLRPVPLSVADAEQVFQAAGQRVSARIEAGLRQHAAEVTARLVGPTSLGDRAPVDGRLPDPAVVALLTGPSASTSAETGEPGVLWRARAFPLNVASVDLRRLTGRWTVQHERLPLELRQTFDGDGTVGTVGALWLERDPDQVTWVCLAGAILTELHLVRQVAEQGCAVAVNVDLDHTPPHPGPDGVITLDGGRVRSANLSLRPPWTGMTFELIDRATP